VTSTFVDLTQPHDSCIRCGRPTPLGVALCDNDNPGHIKGPSTTQVHGTILFGVIGGFVLLYVFLRIAQSGVGPFPSALNAAATRPDGGLDVAVTVTNSGTRASGTSCRVMAAGLLNFQDYVFFTPLIPPGTTRTFTEAVPPLPEGPALPANLALTVRCN
jgi:predicted nucleic acid-binding Zn ribbon protein